MLQISNHLFENNLPPNWIIFSGEVFFTLKEVGSNPTKLLYFLQVKEIKLTA